MNDEERLLNQVVDLRNKYKLVNQLNATEFNIFHILNVHANERYTHSAFIAELLNPRGKHGQGTLFLDIFLTCIKTELFNDIDNTLSWENTKVITEFYTGNKTDRGFIDIVLENDFIFLIIENKINAKDQDQQLKRYEDYAKCSKRHYEIIYLTPDGKDASSGSASGLEKDYIRLSYRNHMRTWLEACLKEVGRKPVIRETIYQYLQIIKYICGIPLNHEEEMELQKLLNNNFKSLEAASYIYNNYWEAKFMVKYNFWKEVYDEIIKYFHQNDKWFVSKSDFNECFKRGDKYPGINVYLKEENCQILRFKIEKLQGRYYYGIVNHDGWDNLPVITKNNYLSECKFEPTNDNLWIYKVTKNQEDFSQMETLEKVFNTRGELKQKILKDFIGFFEEHHAAIENILMEY